MSAPASKQERDRYEERLGKLFEAFRAKGPGHLMAALLAEIETTRSCLSDVPWPEQADRIIELANSYLAGKATLADLRARCDTLAGRQLGVVAGEGKEEAYWQYQWACANLAGVESDNDHPYFVALALSACLYNWPDGECEVKVQRHLLGRLQTALENKQPDGNRLRVSLLAV
jgi:hypothetical protein